MYLLLSLLLRNFWWQRKRTAIGIELVTMPRLLFLDEPTARLRFLALVIGVLHQLDDKAFPHLRQRTLSLRLSLPHLDDLEAHRSRDDLGDLTRPELEDGVVELRDIRAPPTSPAPPRQRLRSRVPSAIAAKSASASTTRARIPGPAARRRRAPASVGTSEADRGSGSRAPAARWTKIGATLVVVGFHLCVGDLGLGGEPLDHEVAQHGAPELVAQCLYGVLGARQVILENASGVLKRLRFSANLASTSASESGTPRGLACCSMIMSSIMRRSTLSRMRCSTPAAPRGSRRCSAPR